jgi:hypothetical protein
MWPAEFNVPCGRCATMKADQLCEWSQDDWEAGTWSAGCGLVWCFEDGGPTENEMKFCPGCGHGLVATPYKDPPDEDEDEVTTDQQPTPQPDVCPHGRPIAEKPWCIACYREAGASDQQSAALVSGFSVHYANDPHCPLHDTGQDCPVCGPLAADKPSAQRQD